MAAVITNIVPTTELEAVNEMLSAIGENPLASGTDLSTVSATTQKDAYLAISTLRNTHRAFLGRGWKFNSEEGVEVSPTATHDWTDTDGQTTELNIFKKPMGVLRIRGTTACSENGDLDFVERRSKDYQETGAAVMVLYDRTYNRDGADSSVYPFIYIDAVWAFDFEDCPEAFRAAVFAAAARRFAGKIGFTGQLAVTQQDEALALRELEKSEGIPLNLNVLDTVDAQQIRGGRPRYGGGRYVRVRPGSA